MTVWVVKDAEGDDGGVVSVHATAESAKAHVDALESLRPHAWHFEDD